MSSGFDVIRRHSSNKAGVRIKELTQELARRKSELAGTVLETDDVRSQGRMDHSTIKLNDERLKFASTLSSSNTDFFYEFQIEPDFNFLKVWIMLDHLGTRIRDMSGFANDARVEGHPTLRRENLDLGFQQTSPQTAATPTMLFNSGTDVVSQTNGEYIWIQDNPSIQFIQFPAGFSIALRFKCLDFNSYFSPPLNITNFRRLATKRDDTTNGWALTVFPTNVDGTQGGVEFEILHNNVQYSKRTTGYTAGLWYQTIITYDPTQALAANRIKIYTAGVENSVTSTFGNNLNTTTNLRIGARGSESGFFYGYIHDYRMYMGKVLTQSEITNLNSNELTIDNITKGHSFVVQYALVSQVLKSTIHRFTIGGNVVRVRTHKYNIIRKITRTRTHKWNTVNKITRTRTHRFTVVGLVLRTRTHKFNMGGTVRVTKTHKYNITGSPVLTQVVRFQKNSSGTNGVTQDISFTFTPKAIKVISVGTTQNDIVGAHFQVSTGFSDGTNHACVVNASRDAVADSDTSRSHRTDSVVAILNDTSNNTVTCRASPSFLTNTVRFTWDVNDTNAFYISVFAVGGAGISNTKVSTVPVSRTTTGVQNYTGLGFDPVQDQSVILTLGGQADSSTSQINTVMDHATYFEGCAVSTSKRWAHAGASPNALATSSTSRITSDNTVVNAINATNNAILFRADFNGWITDGFSLNWTSAPSSSTQQMSYLVIKGGIWDAGTLVSPTVDTANVDYAVSVSSKPLKGLLMFSKISGTVILNSITTHSIVNLGFTDGTTQSCIATIDETSATTMDSYRNDNGTSIIKGLSVNGAILGQATFDSFTTNNFRLDWTGSPNGSVYGWVVVADT